MNYPAYFEIQANDLARARDFYGKIFGWKFIEQKGMPIEYWRIETDGPHGAILPRPAKSRAQKQGTNAFTCSMEVEDFDKTAALILKLGGSVGYPKFAIPGKCWQGYFLDTEDNVFGIFEVDETAK
jgi:predicted enzyme related to lactoylglutathione lyase